MGRGECTRRRERRPSTWTYGDTILLAVFVAAVITAGLCCFFVGRPFWEELHHRETSCAISHARSLGEVTCNTCYEHGHGDDDDDGSEESGDDDDDDDDEHDFWDWENWLDIDFDPDTWWDEVKNWMEDRCGVHILEDVEQDWEEDWDWGTKVEDRGDWRWERPEGPPGGHLPRPDDPDRDRDGRDEEMEEEDRDGNRDGHDGDRDGHDGDSDGHDGDRDGHDGDRDGHHGDRDAHHGDRDGHDGDRNGHDGDRDGHDGDRDGHDGDRNGDRDGHHGDRDGHDGDRDGHHGDRDGHDGDRDRYDGDRDGHDGDSDGHHGDRDGHHGDRDGHDGDRDGHDGDSDGHDGDRDGHHASGEFCPTFDCLEVEVFYRDPKTGKSRFGMLYNTLREKKDYPTCTLSTCQKDSEKNLQRHQQFVKKVWETLRRNRPLRCYVRPHSPEYAILEKEQSPMPAVHSFIWPALVAVICFIWIVARRCYYSRCCGHAALPSAAKKVNSELRYMPFVGQEALLPSGKGDDVSSADGVTSKPEKDPAMLDDDDQLAKTGLWLVPPVQMPPLPPYSERGKLASAPPPPYVDPSQVPGKEGGPGDNV